MLDLKRRRFLGKISEKFRDLGAWVPPPGSGNEYPHFGFRLPLGEKPLGTGALSVICCVINPLKEHIMSDTTYVNPSDLAYGSRVITYALNLLSWGTVIAITWSCSTILMGIIMFIISSIVIGILSGLMNVVLHIKLDASTIESIGRNTASVTARVTGLFTRKVTV